MSELKREVKEKMIESLKLEDMTPDMIIDSDPLFDEGLGLDSIDALELAMILDKDYGIVIKDSEEGKTIFSSVNSMVAYIEEHRAQ